MEIKKQGARSLRIEVATSLTASFLCSRTRLTRAVLLVVNNKFLTYKQKKYRTALPAVIVKTKRYTNFTVQFRFKDDFQFVL